jgi:hypothetical protein
MSEATLDSVIDKLESVNIDYQGLSASLDAASGEMESNTTAEAIRQLSELVKKQSDMSASDRRSSRKDMDNIGKLIESSAEVGDSDKDKFQSLIKMHDKRVRADSSLMNEVGSKITETLTEGVTNIGAVVAGVVSDSPLLALGIKFLGDGIKKNVITFNNFRKKKKEEASIREHQRELFREQERIDAEERKVLREQISESDVQKRLNITDEELSKRAEEESKTKEQIYNEQRDHIIEQSKIAKAQQENVAAEELRIRELKERVGLDLSPTNNERVSVQSPTAGAASANQVSINESQAPQTVDNSRTNNAATEINQVSGDSSEMTRLTSVEGGTATNNTSLSDSIISAGPETRVTIERAETPVGVLPETPIVPAAIDSLITPIDSKEVSADPAETRVTIERAETSAEVLTETPIAAEGRSSVITPIDSKELSVGQSEKSDSSPIFAEIRDLLGFINSSQSDSEMGEIETQREKKRTEQANLRVETVQNRLLEDSIESSEDSRKETGGVLGAISGSLGMFKGIGKFLTTLPRLLMMLLSPIALKIMAVGAAIAATIAFFQSDLPKQIGQFVTALPEKIGETINSAFNSIVEFFNGIIEKIKGFISGPIEFAGNIIDSAKDTAAGAMSTAKELAGSVADKASDTRTFVGNMFEQDNEGNSSRSTISPVSKVVNYEQPNITTSASASPDSRRSVTNASVAKNKSILVGRTSTSSNNVTTIPTALAQGSQALGAGGSTVIGNGTTNTATAPLQQVSGAPTDIMGKITSSSPQVKNAAAISMKENAIEKTSSSNLSPILNNLSNITNNNVSNSSSTVIPSRAYNSENSFTKINSALSGAI